MGIRSIVAALLCAGVFVGVFLGRAQAGELAERAAIESEVQAHMRDEAFATLESMSDFYRSTGARTSSGLWKLTLFYVGLDKAVDGRRRADGDWDALAESVDRWIAAYPQSPAARLARVQLLMNYARSYRSGAFRRLLSWWYDSYHDAYIEQARAYLEETKAIAGQDPRWYELMIKIAYIQDWPEDRLDALVAEGQQKAPGFYQIYFAALDYYAPKWGGSAAKIEAFARRVVDWTRAQEGMGLYARLYWYASQTQYGDALFTDSDVSWPDMKQGKDDVLRAYGDDWNLANFAKFACLQGDRQKTRDLIARVSDSAARQAWYDPADFERCRDFANNG